MSIGAHELELYLDNEQPLNERKFRIYTELARRKDAGSRFIATSARGAFVTLVNNAADAYVREFCANASSYEIFDADDRRAVDASLAERFEAWYAIDWQALKKDQVSK